MSDCRDTRDLLSPYLEGDLSPEERVKVEGHLGECEDCRIDLDLLRRTVVALKGLPDLPPPAGILHGVREGLEPVSWHRRLFGGRRSPLRAGIPLGAVATVLVAFGIFLLTERVPDLGRAPSELKVPPPPVRNGTPPPSPDIPPGAPGRAEKILSKERAEEVQVGRTETEVLEAGKVQDAGSVGKGADKDVKPGSPVAGDAVVAGEAEDREQAPGLRVAPSGKLPAERPAGTAIPEPAAVAGDRPAVIKEEKALPPPAEPLRSAGESNLQARGFADDRMEQPPALEQEVPPAPRGEAELKRAAPALSPQGAREKRAAEATRQAAPPAGEGAFYKALVPPGGREDSPASGERATPAGEAPRDAALEGTTEILTIVSLDGNEMAQLRDTLRDSGGRILEMQTLDAYSSQQVALPYQDRIPPSQAISRGWQIRALVPAENVEDFVSSLEKGSRMQLLHRSTEPPLWPSDPGVQNIQINLVR